MLRSPSLLLVATIMLLGCSRCAAPATSAADAGDAPDSSGQVSHDAGLAVEVYSHTDLPRTGATQGLSATAYDPGTRTLFALQDHAPALVPLVANEDFTAFVPGQAVPLTGRPALDWDGEGLSLQGGGFVAVADESTGLIERFSMTGAYVESIAAPAGFAGRLSGNRGLESLALSPSGKYVYTANEQALKGDGAGPTKDGGTLVRIARLSADSWQGTQHAYRTEPIGPGTGGDMGVSDLAALDDDVLLVLERGYQADYGNTVRLFRVSLAGSADVSSTPALKADTPVVQKHLVVDFASLPSAGFTHPSTQPSPLLDNYEALTIGPVLQDGRRLLFVTSDDNAKSVQVARVLVLAVRGL